MEGRPMPEVKLKEGDEIVDQLINKAKRLENAANNEDMRDNELNESDALLEKMGGKKYKEKISIAMDTIRTKDGGDFYLSNNGLETYSPKFLNLLEIIQNPSNKGLHLLYSQFRSMEGIGIFALVLEHHGFTQFKIKKSTTGIWSLNMSEENMRKPKYALYTGTETSEEKEIVRLLFNAEWNRVPAVAKDLAVEVRETWNNNNLGDIIKVFMITAAGAEGINLKATRFVHLLEPYWHPARQEQVIGRARRICSHIGLPENMRTVDVFIYLMVFTKDQIQSEFATALRKKDLSKLDSSPISTDEYLYEISEIKRNLFTQVTDVIQASSFDCYLHNGDNCLSFANPGEKFSYVPNYDKQERVRQERVEWVGKSITIDGTKYVGREITPTLYILYDIESYKKVVETKTGNPLQIGTYEVINGKGVKKLVNSD
jgi:SNF2 family DNA or RNA helicase